MFRVTIFLMLSILAIGPVAAQTSPDTPRERRSPRGSTITGIGKTWDTIRRKIGPNKPYEPQERRHGSAGAPRGFSPDLPATRVWAGTWVRLECSEVGGASGIGCASQPVAGELRVSIKPEENSSLEGMVEVGEVEIKFSGSVGSDGSLSGAGLGRVLTTDVTITNWSGRRAGDSMTGNFTLTFHPDDAEAGIVILRAAMRDMAAKN